MLQLMCGWPQLPHPAAQHPPDVPGLGLHLPAAPMGLSGLGIAVMPGSVLKADGGSATGNSLNNQGTSTNQSDPVCLSRQLKGSVLSW